MFEGFTRTDIGVPGAQIHLRHGGSGPPLLLLHGNPLTHVMWHKIAPRLAEEFTVVAADLRGYGDSSKPPGGEDHAGYSFRAMAKDQVEVMEQLGFERCFVAGHDRGGRVAHRMALDHPGQGGQGRLPRHRAHAPHAHQHSARVGGRFLPLVLHGAAVRLSRADAHQLRAGALHPQEARQEGRGAGRLHARGDGRVHPLLHAGKHPRGVRGLSRRGGHRPRPRRGRPRIARSRCRCWCCGARKAT